MKATHYYPFSVLCIFLCFTGCKNTRYLTEAYIKNNIEQHIPGNQSHIRTFSIYQGFSIANKKSSAYIEFTGLKYNKTKQLVVGADYYYMVRNNLKTQISVLREPGYVVLELNDCLNILNSYTSLQEKLSGDLPIPNEEIYYDYSVSPDMFISFRKAIGYRGKRNIDVWISGDKYTIKTRKFIMKLKRFINY
jgi:hypothetical protein